MMWITRFIRRRNGPGWLVKPIPRRCTSCLPGTQSAMLSGPKLCATGRVVLPEVFATVRGIRRRPTEADDWKQRARQEGQRPQIEERLGYGVKAATHAMRRCYRSAKNCWPKLRLPFLVPNRTFLSRARGKVRDGLSRLRWRGSVLQNARKRPDRRRWPSEWIGPRCRDS